MIAKCGERVKHTASFLRSIGTGATTTTRLGILLRSMQRVLKHVEAPNDEADAEPSRPAAGANLEAGQVVLKGPKRLNNDAEAVRQVALLDGAAVDGGEGLLREDVGLVGRHVWRRGGVEDGDDDAGGGGEGAESLLGRVREELRAVLEVERRGDEGARCVEGAREVEALGVLGRGARAGEVVGLDLEMGGYGVESVCVWKGTVSKAWWFRRESRGE